MVDWKTYMTDGRANWEPTPGWCDGCAREVERCHRYTECEVARLKLALQDALAGLSMNREVRQRRVDFILCEGRLPKNETGEPT